MPNFAQVGTRGLVRRRLLDELDGLKGGPLALVVAPAGFGKTTLLSHYAHGFDGLVCWLSATPADADPAAFAARLRESDAGTDLDGLLAARPDGRDVLLVIDDAHYLEGSETETALGRLLVAAPPHLHTALGSRRMPGLNLYRHELSGLVVIDADRLRFRSWEAEELLRDVYREPLPPAEVAALARRLGGWVAGLHMFHLSTRGRPLPQRRAAVAAMDGRAALSRAYLARTVLAELPAALRDFLVRTTVFDVVTARRCNRLLGTRDSQGQLESLERLQAFTTSHDGGRTFRYHEVLRACLAVTLADEWGDDAARAWYAKAAALLEAEGALAEATRAYARAEDWGTVRRLLDQIGAGIVDDAVESWSEVLPEWLVAEDPWLVLAEGRHLLSRGQLTAAIEHFGHAEALFTHEDGRAHCRAALGRATLWLPGPSLPGPALSAQAGGAWLGRGGAEWTGLLRAATKRHPAMLAAQAGQRAVPGVAQPVAARCAQVVAHALAGDAARAVRLLGDTDPLAPGLPGLALGLLHAAADLARGDGTAVNRLADVAAEAERRGWPWLTRMARAAVALDQTEQSAKAARAVAEECGREGDAWGEVIASGLAWLPHAGRTGSGTVELADLVRRCRLLDAGVLEAWFHGLFAVAAAVAHLPDADVEAARAASMAQAAGVPGAAVAALAAQACLSGTAAGVAATRAAAREAGLPDALVTAWLASVPAPGPVWSAGPTETGLTVQCLGGFAVHLDGARVDWSAVRPRARVLMRLLALHTGRLVHRDALCEALWPDLTQAAATHNLHVAMSSLRKLLDPGSGRGQSRLLVRDGDAYALALPADGYCDVAGVRSALDQARAAHRSGDRAAELAALRAAVAGYTGDLLPEDGAAEWVVHEREVLRHAVAGAAAALAALELSTGDTAAALAAAERGVAVDRYSDEGWRLLIEAHERDNDLGAASRARLRYADMLIELGVDPVAQLAGLGGGSPTLARPTDGGGGSPSTLARPTPTTRTVAGT
jgi:DNA-binding SARP family transcriptional activator